MQNFTDFITINVIFSNQTLAVRVPGSTCVRFFCLFWPQVPTSLSESFWLSFVAVILAGIKLSKKAIIATISKIDDD